MGVDADRRGEEAPSVSEFAYTGNAIAELATGLDDVRAWWCRLSEPDRSFDELEAMLSSAEHARAARFGTDALRRRYVVGRSTLRRTLALRLGVAPADVPIVRGPRGRPMLDGVDGLDFNVSHTRDRALVAHLRHARDRIGADIEHEDRRPDVVRLSRRVLAEVERTALASVGDPVRTQRFLRLWTCKEAMSKATGDGLRAPFRRLVVDLEPCGATLRDGPAPYQPSDWSLHPIPLPDGYIATLARWRRGG